ncbi:phosphatidate cytidylyltransferase [Desulfovibrio sp. OttesenSCG-928-A18]|nr:phosphatidate cytidylyltransferase [Desulfovibrio sp. OttesenSCG-928-A18]
MHLTSHQKRIVTGLVLLALLIVCIAKGGLFMLLLVLAASLLTLYEFFCLYWPGTVYMGRKIFGLVLGALVVLSQSMDPLWTMTIVCLGFFAAGMLFLARFGRGDAEARLGHYAPLLHGIIYIPLVLQLALYLGPAEQALVLLAAVASDTGGYYAGTLWGKRKLWPSISPKKSWAGLFGGMFLCVLCTVITGPLAEACDWRMIRLPFWGWLLAGLFLHQAAVFGDFFESALKRSLNIKDSGAILPGHGGMLDRLDSVLFVLPAFMILRLLVRILQGS